MRGLVQVAKSQDAPKRKRGDGKPFWGVFFLENPEKSYHESGLLWRPTITTVIVLRLEQHFVKRQDKNYLPEKSLNAYGIHLDGTFYPALMEILEDCWQRLKIMY